MHNEKYYEIGAAESPIIDIFAYGKEQAEKIGAENVFDYSIGSPSRPTPKELQDTIKRLIDEEISTEIHGYTVEEGTKDFRKAVAENLKRRFGAKASPERIYISTGCTAGVIAVARALVEKETDEIMVLAPFFTEYDLYINKSSGGKMTVVPPTEGFRLNLAGVEACTNENSVAIIVNSPCNPTGVAFTEEEIRSLAALLEKKSAEYGHPIYIISDEPYREIAFDGFEAPFVANIYKNTIVCYSWSKAFSIPGERIGYVWVPDECEDGEKIYMAAFGASRAAGFICAPSLMQKAVELCIDVEPPVSYYEEHKDLIYGALSEMGYECIKPEGAFYLFVKAPNGDSESFCKRAMVEQNILMVPGTGSGCPEYMRLCYAIPKDKIERSLPGFKALIETCRA